MTPRCGPGVVWKPLSDQDTSERPSGRAAAGKAGFEAGRCATWKRHMVFRQPAPGPLQLRGGLLNGQVGRKRDGLS